MLLLRRLEKIELSHIPVSTLSSCGAFSSPTAASLNKLISVIKKMNLNAFYDMGSGSGIVVAAAASHEIKSYGIELNPNLHRAALNICEVFCPIKDSFHLRCENIEELIMEPDCSTAFYAFDVHYSDSLIKKIIKMFLNTPQKGFLITTKNEQGLGAALCDLTNNLRDATEDLKACIQDPGASDTDIKETRDVLQAIREKSLETFDIQTKGQVEFMKSFDFLFGSGEEGSPTDTCQDENLMKDVTKKYCEKLMKKETELMSGTVEKTKIYVFSKIDCWGCREDQGNQEAHTDYGGCLYEDFEEEEKFGL